jgi:hypothetical protein
MATVENRLVCCSNTLIVEEKERRIYGGKKTGMAEMDPLQGCQMVHFQTNNLGKFGRVLKLNILVHVFLWPFDI